MVGDQSPTIDTPRIPRANPYSECPASNERWGDKGGLSLIWQRSTPPLHPPSLPFSNSFYAYGPPPARTTPSPATPSSNEGREKEEKRCAFLVPHVQTCVDAARRREREERDRIGGGGGSGTGKWKGRGRRQRVGGLEGAVEKKGEEVRLVWQREGGVGVELGTSRADDE